MMKFLKTQESNCLGISVLKGKVANFKFFRCFSVLSTVLPAFAVYTCSFLILKMLTQSLLVDYRDLRLLAH